MLDGPVEWVPGDPVWPRRFRVIQDGIWVGLIGGNLILALQWILVVEAVLPGPIWYPSGGIWVIVPWLAYGLALVPLTMLPGRRPVIGAIGISPWGLSIPVFRKTPLPWNLVRWTDTTHVAYGPDRFSPRVELTPYQAARIRHFFGPG